jgi:hypothetical protein
MNRRVPACCILCPHKGEGRTYAQTVAVRTPVRKHEAGVRPPHVARIVQNEAMAGVAVLAAPDGLVYPV